MEAYDPATVFSSIDHGGRYAYGNQANVARWNLARLAEALLPVLAEETGDEAAAVALANEQLSAFEPQFQSAWSAGLRQKVGISAASEEADALAEDLLQRMATNQADFTLTFRRLCDAAASPASDAGVRTLFADPRAYESWAVQWREFLREQPADGQARATAMRRVNPVFIPRNHLVEAALEAATWRQDFQLFEELLDAVTRPYEERLGLEHYATPARPEERVLQTFCGT
jgi:uncharacterized protein YdiU (UPF0061 family)